MFDNAPDSPQAISLTGTAWSKATAGMEAVLSFVAGGNGNGHAWFAGADQRVHCFFLLAAAIVHRIMTPVTVINDHRAM